MVEDPRALVRHPDLIGVGKGESDTHVHVVPGLSHQVAFNAEISGRFLDPRQDLFERRPYLVRPMMFHERIPLRAFKRVNSYDI